PFYSSVYYPFSPEPHKTHATTGIPTLLNSPGNQTSSGDQSRPASLAMSAASVSAPFKFRTRRESVDWRRINAVDVDRVACELDFQMLQEHIAGVTFCSIEGERCLNCQSPVDPALLKLFRLAQLTIEYLLHSQDCLALSLQTAEEQFQTGVKEKQQLQVQLQKQSQDIKSLKDELKQRKKIIASQQAMISAGLSNYHKCQHCEKAFMNTSFLQSHMKRRHPMEHDMKLITDNQKDLQTLKLQEEIIRLQDQLNLAKSEMEAQQKDYNTKQEKDLTQKQADFMKQLEVWKENERVRMNSRIDEVKQACQKDMESMLQKNQSLENQVLKLQQSSKVLENMQPVKGQAGFGQNSEDKQRQKAAQLRQKLDNQEIAWSAKMQKMKEEFESEKKQLQTALFKAHTTVSKERKRVERQVKKLEHRLEEQTKLITSQNMQVCGNSGFSFNSPFLTQLLSDPLPPCDVLLEQSSLVYKLDPIMELSEEDKDSSSFSEGLADHQSREQKVKELLKNPSLKRDMHLAVQQSLNEKFLHLGIDPVGVVGLSKTTFESGMARVVFDRRQGREYAKVRNDLIQKLEKRLKERCSSQPAKSKPSEQARTLPQARSQSNSLSVTVTRVVSGPPAKQQYTPQSAHRNNNAIRPTTLTQMPPHRPSRFSVLEDSSSEEESEKDSPQAQKIRHSSGRVKSHSTVVQQHTAPSALASYQSSGSQQAPVFSISKTNVTVAESESEWTEGSEMEEISLNQLQEHTDQNGNVPKTSSSYVKTLSNNLDQRPADQSHKKTAGVSIPDKPTGGPNTNDAVWEIKHTDFEEDNDDDWDISSLEDVPAAHKTSSAPVRKSKESLDTSTSVWGTFTSKGREPGLKDTGTGSTLKSSTVTVSDWDDSDGI
ncbi:zinc finger protein Dzip1 isoform 1, partial [Silurus meridionalis]